MSWIGKIGLAVIGATCLFSCDLIHDDDMKCQHYTADGVPFAYVGLNISAGNANQVTKANPTGGEEGDGREEGVRDENVVSTIIAFFFETDKGINSDASTRIVARQSWPSSAFTYKGNTQYTTDPIEVEHLQVGHTYDVLVVTNVDPTFGMDVNTLGELRNMTTSDIWKYGRDWASTEERYIHTKFVMASADAGNKLFIHNANSSTNPATTSLINVERLSARVDYQARGSEGEAAGVYKVMDKTTNAEIGKAKILGAMLINTLNATAPSYLFKHVTKENEDFTTGAIDYLGLETVKGGNVATNYVLDPKSREGKYKADFEPVTYYPNIGYADLDWSKKILTKSCVAGLTDDYICIGYPKENVNRIGKRTHTTGVVFQAQYTPMDFTEGDTYFEWNGKIYATLEAMEQAYDGTGLSWKYITGHINDDGKDIWDDVTTWASLRTDIIARIKVDDPAGYRAWLVAKSKNKEGTLDDATKKNLRWDWYVTNFLRYSVSGGKATVDVGASDGFTRNLLHQASGVATYKEGICYYTYWIKHANDQDPSNDLVKGKSEGGGVMEYAIVRNNIYKLRVMSISTPGGDIPGDRTVNVNVLVENWDPLNREDIVIK